MKTLLLIRHAKSSWNNVILPDFERPLNERGKYDAPLMAKRIKEKKIEIDAFVSSPAKRAKKTAEIFMDEFNAKGKKLIFIPSLYEATSEKFYDAIENLKDKYDTVALFAHNPGITDFINSLECSPVYNMPTCGVYAVKIKIKNWKEFRKANKEFLFFDYPKSV
ncbi:MAG TPA: histidine phosphatase family protein [Ginsengibacter sp.]|jgi:phosphohistidine phosphatase